MSINSPNVFHSHNNSSQFLFSLSFQNDRPIKIVLISAAVVYLIEFIICNLFFAQTSTPFFLPPIPTPSTEGTNFLYAHSITRQYGFFVIQLALTSLLFGTNPVLFQNFIRAFAAVRFTMVVLGVYALVISSISLMHFLPVLIWEAGVAVLLLILCPSQKNNFSHETERLALKVQQVAFGIKLAPHFQHIALRVLCAIAGVLWILWALGSTIFWEVGVANISSDKTAEMNLVAAMRLNSIVRCEQGVMLFGIGLLTLLTSQFPVFHRQMLVFIMAQQVINALSAAVELAFGTILFPQFLLVASVQVITFILFFLLYPRLHTLNGLEADVKTTQPQL
ncbi:MAG: hypothetical protein SFU91_04140 [Chloroherpetonaceae bacterium]|nr:hypothetical protein [Chloroherpetonaceae bacterium]